MRKRSKRLFGMVEREVGARIRVYNASSRGARPRSSIWCRPRWRRRYGQRVRRLRWRRRRSSACAKKPGATVTGASAASRASNRPPRFLIFPLPVFRRLSFFFFFVFVFGWSSRRGLAQSMGANCRRRRLHIAHFVTWGIRSAARTRRTPSGGLDARSRCDRASYGNVLQQPRSAWRGNSKWRPWVEKFFVLIITAIPGRTKCEPGLSRFRVDAEARSSGPASPQDPLAIAPDAEAKTEEHSIDQRKSPSITGHQRIACVRPRRVAIITSTARGAQRALARSDPGLRN